MRFVHTADWHLGRILCGVHLTEDQAHVLEQLVDVVKQSKADAVILAGDVFDRSVPPPEAVDLLDHVLSRLALEVGVPVIVIAGNHDSPRRLQFGSRLLSSRKLHIFGAASASIGTVTLEDQWGPIRFHAVPYAEPAVVRQCFGDETIQDHDAAMKRCVDAIDAAHPPGGRRVLIGHAFVQGGGECESERPLSVGGAGTVAPGRFDGFDYTALGHLHAPQKIAEGRIRYCGSLLRYSFGENHAKGVNVVEMDAQGGCEVEFVPLIPRRQVRCIEGFMEEILRGPTDGQSRDDYVQVKLLDSGAVLDAMNRIRQAYPNVLNVDRPALTAAADGAARRPDHTKLSDAQLFADFFEQVAGQTLTAEESAAFVAAVDALRLKEREALT